MRLAHRARHLERLDAVAHPPGVVEQLQSALDEAALRLVGRGADAIRDAADVALVSDDVQNSFIEKLSDGDLASLIAGLELITVAKVAAS